MVMDSQNYIVVFLAASDPDVPFELYQVLPPNIAQTLPEGKPFDQVGPIELFRYGKIKRKLN